MEAKLAVGLHGSHMEAKLASMVAKLA
jgi:hypothetical protein